MTSRPANATAARVDASRTDTVRVIRFRTDTLIASADSVGRLLDSTRSRIRKQMADSTQRVFDAWAAMVAARDSVRIVQIANLNRVIAIQDSSNTDLRARLAGANALLAQAMPQLKAALARANRRWGLCVMGGYGATVRAGVPTVGPQLGVGVCWRIL